ncbi:hypothetical protein PSENEW3_00004185 [Picochlorum sp. SENEW3]|nr:hypothetical protein PSENEW3_00004185 [Picochlorum sp. SENEW3]
MMMMNTNKTVVTGQHGRVSLHNGGSEVMDLVTPKSREVGLLARKSDSSVDHLDSCDTDAAVLDDGVSAKEVLVAKRLTNSDSSSGRIILPRVAVETNMSFVTAHRHYALHVKDVRGVEHEFVVKSWANGTEHRRVFVLEQVGKFLKQYHVGVGDTVGICRVGDGFVVEVNTDDVKMAAMNGRCTASTAVTASHMTSTSQPKLAGSGGKCKRSAHCSKVAGHPGFCSGRKASTGVSNNSYKSSQSYYYSGEDSSHFGVDGSDFTSSDESGGMTMVFMTQDMVNSEMSKLPDGLNRLMYVPSRVKIVKKLTEYDLSSRRIVLPAEQVAHGLIDVSQSDKADMYHSLATVDESQGWQFMALRTWHSVTGRKGYYIEDKDDLMKSRGANAGDYLMIYRDSIHDPPRMVFLDGESHRVKKPVNGPDAAIMFSELPVLLLPPGENSDVASTHHAYSLTGNKGVRFGERSCNRTHGCTKAFGHQGFCSGHRGFKRKDFDGRYGAYLMEQPSEDDDDHVSYHKSPRYCSVSTPRGASDPLVSLLNLLE